MRVQSDLKIFSARLEYLLSKREISQKDLSKKTNLPQPTVSHFVNGKREPTLHSLIKLCEALRCSSDYLLGLSESLEESPTKDELFSKISLLSDEKYEVVVWLVKALGQIKLGHPEMKSKKSFDNR